MVEVFRRTRFGFLGLLVLIQPAGAADPTSPKPDFNRDVWIRPADGSEAAHNVSRHPDNEDGPVWSPDGKMLAFTGRRFDDETDIFYLWLERQEAQERLHQLRETLVGEEHPGAEPDRDGRDVDHPGGAFDRLHRGQAPALILAHSKFRNGGASAPPFSYPHRSGSPA